MKLELFERITLKDGRKAFIVEIYDNGEAFEVDVEEPDGECDTITIRPEDIDY